MNGTQLKLFSEPTVGSTYRPGDWVKVRKKPAIGAHIKRGEYFEVNAVHPTNGSIRIWNPHINQWDFLYPDEIKLSPNPNSTTIVESVVEIQSSIKSVVEIQLPVKTIPNSTTIVESVVEIQSSTGRTNNGWLDYHYKIRVDGKQRSVRYPQIGCTGPYHTYRWKEIGKQRGKYVPASKYPAVRRAIAIGQSIAEILEIISSQ